MLYGFASVCLNVSGRRRLDGFQNKCLRDILCIRPSFYSRITNASVLQQASVEAASRQLETTHLQLFGKVIRAAPANPLRSSCLVGNTLQPLTSYYIRRVGRPRKEWVTTILPRALQQAGGSESTLSQLVQDPAAWKRLVKARA